MLVTVVRTSLRFRHILLAGAIAFLVAGGRGVRDVPLDVFPEFAPPRVEIQTEAPGLSTEEVESLVTAPLEGTLDGVPWVESLRSKSVLGLSSIVLIFEDGTDPIRARQVVQERLASDLSRLPSVARPPVVLPPLSSLSRVMKIGIASTTMDQVELSERVRFTVRPRLMAVPGVANVAVWGQRDRQLQVLIDPQRLDLAGVTAEQVQGAVAAAVAVGAGGFIDTPNQRLPVRQLPAVRTACDLGAALVTTRGGVPVRVDDVARVEEGHAIPIGDAVINDGPGLLLIVDKEPWGNTLDVTRGVEAALVELSPALAGMEVDPTIFRPATFIERSLHNLRHALLVGCALVAAVLVLFLFDWRSALISLVAIPLSLLAAALIVSAHGGTLNVMTIAGLVIALGEVVDDAIIDVENIVRRWRQRRPESAADALRVVFDASIEVRGAVVYASLIVILVFVPVLVLDGLAGAFFRPLALAYVAAIAASLCVAVTVTPALALLLFRRHERTRSDSLLLRLLKASYRPLLAPLIRWPRLTATAVVVAIGVTATLAAGFGEEFLPSFRENDYLMHFVGKPGTSLDAMRRVTLRASEALRGVDGVRNFGAHIGRAEVADEVVGPNFAELWISVDEDADHDVAVADVGRVIDGFPGLYRDVLTYLRERVKEVLTGASASIVVRIYGDDLEDLRASAQDVAHRVGAVEGVSSLKVEAQASVPQVTVRLRPQEAARLGVTAREVFSSLETYVRGRSVGQLSEAGRSVDVVVIGEPSVRADVMALRNIRVPRPAGASVPLDDVAEIRVEAAPNEMKRENGSRRIDVTCEVHGRDLGAVARGVEAAVAGAPFRDGEYAEVLGEYQALVQSRSRLLEIGVVVLLGILLLLHADFGAWRPALLVFGTLPFALIGGVIGVWWGGGVLSLGSLVGFVTVLGIAARNGILLVGHYQRLEREGARGTHDLLIRGAEERLSPILMTALSAGLGMLPLALRGDLPGHEIEHPLALVIVGGLVTSTALNLLVVPALYGWLVAGTADSREEVP